MGALLTFLKVFKQEKCLEIKVHLGNGFVEVTRLGWRVLFGLFKDRMLSRCMNGQIGKYLVM